LVNLSARGFIPARSELAAGFHAQARIPAGVLIRAAGPGLAAFGLPRALPAIQCSVWAAGAAKPLAENSGWNGQASLREAFVAVGAFPFAEGSRDAALRLQLPSGGHTVRIGAASGETEGVALAELYVLPETADSDARFTNLSALGRVASADEVLLAGFTLRGGQSRRLLLRAVGPGLRAFGIPDALNDPYLALWAAGGTGPLRMNDDWPGLESVRAAMAGAGAFELQARSKDAVLIVDLLPGGYTAIVSGVQAADRGRALVEIYDLGP